MSEKNEDTESKRRTEVKDLSRAEEELSKEEQKNVKGGVIRSVGGRDGGSGGGGTDPNIIGDGGSL